ncbi:MAG: OmpA family protein [Desulfovibrionaceae bacterium]|nr:OmpA family protein [Desulfovibrionaceae bacterium]MBF0515187.1 OmpA family protein [Desulfovibrionaceae bacterium]
MAASPDKKKAPIIVKKIKKGGAGAHGGSWKVAYADFVTAMMAFFLLMWLINSTPQEKKKEIASYFQDFALFDNRGSSIIPMDVSGMNTPGAVVEPLSVNPDVVPGGPADQGAEAAAKELAAKAKEKAAKQLEGELQSDVPELKDQFMVSRQDDAIRVEIVENGGGKPLFPAGRTELTPEAKKAVDAVASRLTTEKVFQNLKIAIEGHTDATPYPSDRYTNWDLSAERALSARREFDAAKFPPDRIVQVAGYAATKLLFRDNPADPRNRRISILIEPFAPKKAKADQAAAQAAPTEDPNVVKPKGNVLEQQIEKVYDKATETKK